MHPYTGQTALNQEQKQKQIAQFESTDPEKSFPRRMAEFFVKWNTCQNMKRKSAQKFIKK
ncbi:hypothetical protein DW739_09860 [Clostridium sp. AM28-20LB]|nr:hypothetical protein DW739_09860 [Clostridium sp. AM28-20LB]